MYFAGEAIIFREAFLYDVNRFVSLPEQFIFKSTGPLCLIVRVYTPSLHSSETTLAFVLTPLSL